MTKLKRLSAFTIVLSAAAFCAAARTQSMEQQPAAQRSGDPFVQHREEVHKARQDYESGKISLQEYENRRAAASTRLEETGERGIFERNLEIRQPPGTSRTGK